jgi:hypothetical protein
MPDALRFRLTEEEVEEIHAAKKFEPLFPMSFVYNYKGGQEYSTSLGVGNNQQYQMTAWVDGPLKDGSWPIHE